MAKRYADFVHMWCKVLGEVGDGPEKDSAFRGMCTVVLQNPAGIYDVCLGRNYGLGEKKR